MANSVLACSIVCSIVLTINYLIQNDAPVIIKLLIMSGMASSIANHAYTNKTLKLLDRFTMRVVAIVYIHILHHNNERYLVILGSALYVMSKQTKNRYLANIFHIGAHMCATYLNLFVLHMQDITQKRHLLS